MTGPNRSQTSRTRRGVAALSCAATLAVASCGGSDDQSSTDTDPASTPDEPSSATTDPSSTTGEPSTADPTPSAGESAVTTAGRRTTDAPTPTSDGSSENDAELLPSSPTFIGPGVYSLGQLGIDGTFVVDDDWFVQIAGPDEIIFHDRDGGAGVQEVQILRPDFLADPSYVAPPDPSAVIPSDRWPVDDIEEWVDTGSDIWNAGDSELTDIADLNAVSFSIEPDIPSCDDEPRCPAPIAFAGQAPMLAWEDNHQRIWWLADVDGKAFAVNAALGSEADETWFDDVESLVDSIELASAHEP